MNFGDKIWIIDGGMGSTILEHYPHLIDNCATSPYPATDYISIKTPQCIAEIHRSFLEAGADIICTNTFNICQLYHNQDLIALENICTSSTQIARKAADEFMQSHPERKIFVAGCVGPISYNSEADNIDMISKAYLRQLQTMINHGIDVILIETVVDLKMADLMLGLIFEQHISLPVMLSIHVDNHGQTIMKQSRDHIKALALKYPIAAFGLNCGNNADFLAKEIEHYSDLPCALMVYPNAGLPNSAGKYPTTPQSLVNSLTSLITGRRINIVGGCCGTTPSHICAISKLADGHQPRIIPFENN